MTTLEKLRQTERPVLMKLENELRSILAQLTIIRKQAHGIEISKAADQIHDSALTCLSLLDEGKAIARRVWGSETVGDK